LQWVFIGAVRVRDGEWKGMRVHVAVENLPLNPDVMDCGWELLANELASGGSREQVCCDVAVLVLRFQVEPSPRQQMRMRLVRALRTQDASARDLIVTPRFVQSLRHAL
jgi:hypothetical protein